MTKILITGGEGMIGLELQKLIDADTWDIKNGKDVLELDRCSEEYDGIVHLAAVSRVVEGYRQPKETWKVNTNGTLAVLCKARDEGSWVLNGSSFTAGKSKNVYSYSKEAGENLCSIFSHNYGLDCLSVEFSTVYGSLHDRDGRFIPSVARRLENGVDPLKLEDRNALLSPTYIDDVVSILAKLIESSKKEWNGQVHPIVSKEGFLTTEKMVNLMCDIAGKNPQLIWGDKREWDSRTNNTVENGILTDTSFKNGFCNYYESLQKCL